MKPLSLTRHAMLRRWLIALSCAASPAQASGSSVPPEVLRQATAQFTVGAPLWHSLILGNPVTEAKLITLEGARKNLSSAEWQQDMDGSDRRYWLCYWLPHARQSLWLVSDARKADGSHRITRITLRNQSDPPTASECPALRSAQHSLTLDGYDWVGASSAEVQSVMGVSTLPADGWWRFEHHRRVEGKCDRTRYRTNWLWLHFAKGRVDGIDAGQIASC
ncbi:hypothetical protein [Pseudomonas nicosulfuronedens]